MGSVDGGYLVSIDYGFLFWLFFFVAFELLAVWLAVLTKRNDDVRRSSMTQDERNEEDFDMGVW